MYQKFYNDYYILASKELKKNGHFFPFFYSLAGDVPLQSSLFLSDLVNLASKNNYDWFACSRDFLAQNRMKWSERQQKNHIKKLIDCCYLHRKTTGDQRYLRIDDLNFRPTKDDKYINVFACLTEHMSQAKALFLSHLAYISTHPRTELLQSEGHVFFSCRTEYLTDYNIMWAKGSVRRYTNELRKEGYIKTLRARTKGIQYICIMFEKIRCAVLSRKGDYQKLSEKEVSKVTNLSKSLKGQQA